jgi:hypothetical protein
MSRASQQILDQSIVRSVKLLMGFSVPHLGFDAGSLLPIVSGQVNENFVKSVMNGSLKLRRLDEEWMKLVKLQGIKLFSFYESLDSPTAMKVRLSHLHDV